MDHEIRGFRLGDILAPNTEDLTPRNIRLLRRIRETLPKAFQWSDPERRIFVSLEPGEGKEPNPRVIAGEYLNVVEMIPQEKPTYTFVHETDSDRTLIFDGNNYWRWKPREKWVLARRIQMDRPAPVQETSFEDLILV